MVTDRDILYRVVAQGLDPRETRVSAVLSRPVVSCAETDPLRTALDLMAAHHVRRLPVRDAGGRVTGWISHAPDSTPLIARLVGTPAPPPMLLVADRPLVGLAANTQPDVGLVPNNHLAYAVQWFLFAGVAASIYVLALRRRGG